MKDTAVLLIHCPDRKGLVARVAGLLYEHGANILHADQHQDHDLGLFFMRVEWSLAAGGALDKHSGEMKALKTGAPAEGLTASGALDSNSGEINALNAGAQKANAVGASGSSSSRKGAEAGGGGFDLEGFRREFSELAADLGMRWQLTEGARRPRMALYCSQYLHCMADLLHRWRTGELRLRDSADRLEPSKRGGAGQLLRSCLRACAG